MPLTSRSSIKQKIANYSIVLKHSQFAGNQKLNENVINTVNALLHLGKSNMSPAVINQIDKILTKRDRMQLKRNLANYPDWLVPFLLQLIRK